MNVRHEQFIGIYEDAFSKEYCDAVIQYYENMADAGFTRTRQQVQQIKQSQKDDAFVFSNDDTNIPLLSSKEYSRHFNKILWEKCYLAYANKFWILNELAPHGSYAFKIQKTCPGQGYHMWHCESDSKEVSHRVLVWTLYLNDVEEGGETEFIYQHIRIKPKQGTFVMWPAGFTHTHRGNPPLSGDKYIVTGWIEY